MLAELVSIILRIGLLLGATWGVLYLGADKFDREFVTGIWIVVLFLIAEALGFEPGRSLRGLIRRLLGRDQDSSDDPVDRDER